MKLSLSQQVRRWSSKASQSLDDANLVSSLTTSLRRCSTSLRTRTQPPSCAAAHTCLTRSPTSAVATFLSTNGYAAALRVSARHQSDSGFTKGRHVQYVSAQVPEFDLSRDGDDANGAGSNGAAGGGGGADGADGGAAAAEEPSVVDFTTDVPADKLDKLYRRSNKGAQFLSPSERRMFTKMIYDKFYKDEGVTVMDPAMVYQAALEIQWVEEWVAATAKESNVSPDDARREVKKALLERVDLHKPLSYIVGSQPFFGCDIHCEEPLLCPRPETEMWTHWLVYNDLGRIRNHSKNNSKTGGATAEDDGDTLQEPRLNILDVCCGTGCIGVALAKHLPSAVVTALDILPQAVTVSQENARRNGIPDSRYRAIESDMFDYFLEAPVGGKAKKEVTSSAGEAGEETNGVDGAQRGKEELDNPRPLGTIKAEYVHTFDVIVSNPPYVLPNQYIDLPRTITHWESKTALVGDDYRESRQYLYFKELCVHGATLLRPRHMRPAQLRETPNMLIEVGLQAHMVAELMEKSNLWRDVNVHLDYAQQERWVSAIANH